jgi:hypothetical protein
MDRDPASTSTRRPSLAPVLPYALAGLLTFILVLPGFVYPYLFDDYGFLVRALTFSPAHLLPDPSTLFYRPVSRDLYFALLQTLSPRGPLLGHALNALALIVSSLLIVQIGTRCLGRREGALAGVYFAALGQIPLLVAWVSGAQDALAIVFTLAAMALECRRDHRGALVAAAVAVLCKETAVAALPALALTNLLFRRAPGDSKWGAFDYMILGVLWGAAHPGIHHLAKNDFHGDEWGYLGFADSFWASLVRYIPLLANLPSPGLAVRWPGGLTGVAIAAVAVAIVTVCFLPVEPIGEAFDRPPRRRFALAAGSLVILPLVASGALVRLWAPYYMVFPGIGVAWLLAMMTARLSSRILIVLVPLYVIAGVFTRGMEVHTGETSERSLAPAASALIRLEPQFRALVPSIPRGAQVLIANEVRGNASVHYHLYAVPMIQQWYRDSSIVVVRPELREAGRPDYLLWLNQDLNLFQIDLRSLLPRSVSKPASYDEYSGVMRAYTRGLAESGQLGRAVRILLAMPERIDRVRWWDRRLAASYLFAFGRSLEGDSLIAGAPPIDRTRAFDLVAELLSQPTRVPRYDAATFSAFDLDYTDPEAVRGVLVRLNDIRNPAAARFALRLLVLRPGDPEARAILRAYPPVGR